MTEYSKAVREEAARRANAASKAEDWWKADEMAEAPLLRALCQAVLDGNFHLDPVALARARWEEARRRVATNGLIQEAFFGVIAENWTPPEPMDLVDRLFSIVDYSLDPSILGHVREALNKLGLTLIEAKP